ncbi:MAG: electron transport complex subunit RsxC [Phycisphaerae bacterium]|jgi:electron transport complex protein RnfC
MSAGIVSGSSGLCSFQRGIHPPHRKEYTESLPIKLFVPKKDLIVPMAQNLGAACTPVVKLRDEVKLGDRIADTESFVSAPIHSSINGTVGASTIALLPSGRRVPAVTIKLPAEGPAMPEDFLEQFLDRNWDGVEPTSYDPEEICKQLRAMGLVGQGGATFPTFIKLKRNPERPVDTVILNGAECEPYLTADHRLMLECPEAIVTGLQLAVHAAGAERGIVAIEENKPDAIELMRKIINGRPRLELVVCATKYPMGGERQLIPAVLKRTVPSAPRGLPLDVGVVVVNVATAHSIARAVVRQQPFTHRVVSITGGGVRQPGNYLVPIGTAFSELIETCGGVTANTVKVIAGGPMMGPTVPNLNVPVVKGVNGILVLTDDEVDHVEEGPCIRCGRCIDNCPLYLSPTKLAHAVKFHDMEMAEQYDLMACCECGCCAFVCPAHIPLPQYMRSGKTQLRAIQAERRRKAEAEKARQAAEQKAS